MNFIQRVTNDSLVMLAQHKYRKLLFNTQRVWIEFYSNDNVITFFLNLFLCFLFYPEEIPTLSNALAIAVSFCGLLGSSRNSLLAALSISSIQWLVDGIEVPANFSHTVIN